MCSYAASSAVSAAVSMVAIASLAHSASGVLRNEGELFTFPC